MDDKQLAEILRFKVILLSEGLEVSDDVIQATQKAGIQFDMGRQGGAGPAGGRIFKFSNGSIVNTPLYRAPYERTTYRLRSIGPTYEVQLERKDMGKVSISEETKNTKESEDPIHTSVNHPKITLIPTPKFYGLNNEDGISYKKIALMHGDEALATTINQRCRYWKGDQQCKFCGLELSLQSDATIEVKSGKQLVDTIRIAREEDPNYAKHLTLTIGTTPTKDKGMQEYLEVISTIRQTYPKIPIHIQIEPMTDMTWYQRIKDAGANTIGIHLEILNDEVRSKICPGKAHISKDTYYQHWDHAISVFGKNQVSTFILTGFYKNLTQFKQQLREALFHGVLPVITPARHLNGTSLPTTYTSAADFLEILQYSAQLCHEFGSDPTANKAGCIKCGGCSPLIDAYRL
ncbi:MAG: radical SAM protein [Promethearchaeota archaeon]